MKRLLITLTAAALLAIGVAAVVLADSGSIKDPKGDVQHNPNGNDANYDIVKATFGHAKHGELKHKVTVAGKIGDPRSGGPNFGSTPGMFFDVPGQVADNPTCDYFLQSDPPGTPNNHTDHIKYHLYKCKNEPPNPPVGSARVTRVKPDTDKLVFKRSAIGNPSKYGWEFAFITDTNQGFAVADRAPNQGFKVHHLR